ncbi:MAG TPA: hypothetical protein ENJ90_06450, partial [Devosia sp.]|nr:hypothetical protein [Devosia sp.]
MRFHEQDNETKRGLVPKMIILPTRRAVLKTALAGLAGMAASSTALAQLQIVVSGAEFTPLPIAVPDFASSDPAFGREVADIVRANLRRSGLFSPLAISSMPASVGNVGVTPDFAAWQATNVD